jgi:hypothetical protein
MTITVSEAIGLLKTLQQRHAELKALRDENGHRERRLFGVGGDKEIVKEPVYNVKKLDQTTNQVALQIRKLDNAIKQSNATTQLLNFDWDDSLLGVIETND